MPVTQIDTNQWLIEFTDHLTRQDGSHDATVQIVAEIEPGGIHLRPWRIVHNTPSGQVVSPLPNTQAMWEAYRPVALLELFTPLVLSTHKPYGEMQANTSAAASLEKLASTMRRGRQQ